MSVLEENSRVLAERHPAAAAVLGERTRGASGLAVSLTPSGGPTAKLDGIYLHGRHDPSRDAVIQVRQEIDPACTTIVAMGFGLGYGPEAARQSFPSVPLLVVEPDAALFHDALAARDLRILLADPGVHLHVGASPEGLPLILESLPLARPAFLRLRPALRMRPSAYRASEETIQSWLLRRDINGNTLHRFGRLWVRNLCRNMGEFLRCPGLAPLAGLFDGIPALVVAGGPSLDSVAGQLGDLRQRMLIVSVNTSLPACRRRGVEPDFTVVVDPQFWASRSLDWFPVERGVVVAEPSTCPRVFRRENERFFLCSSLFPLGESLEEAVGEKGPLGAGGSVSTSAWDLARLLGARPLYAAGLDLGFPGMRAHCRGTYSEGMWLAAADRLTPLEGSAFAAVRDIGLFPARASDGGTTPTDRRMLLYKWWFENQLRIHPDVACRTLSPRSVVIEGMPLAPMEEALRLPVVRPAIDERMQRVRQAHAANAGRPAAKARLSETLRDLVRQLSELERLSAQGRTRSQDLGRALAARSDPRECVRDLDRIDEAILTLSARTIAGFLIQSIIHGLLGEGERTPEPQEVVSRSDSVYAGIAESAAWQRGLIERALMDLEVPAGSPSERLS